MAPPPPPRSAVSTTPVPPSSPPRRTASAWPWLLLVLALAAGAVYGWRQWQARAAREQAAAVDAGLRLDALDARFDAMRRDQRAQTQRLQQADATNRLLRDELLGIGQRAALLEDSVAKLVDPDRHGAQALRLDEAELLLAMADRRLQIAGDLDGARRAYALAAGVLAGVDDPAYLSLRQTLQQERAALDALGVEPRLQAMAKLDAFASALLAAPPRADDDAPSAGRGGAARSPASSRCNRAAATSRCSRPIAPPRRPACSWNSRWPAPPPSAATRPATAPPLPAPRPGWPRLWPPSQALQRQRAQLDALAALPLSLSLPTLGTHTGATAADARVPRGTPMNLESP